EPGQSESRDSRLQGDQSTCVEVVETGRCADHLHVFISRVRGVVHRDTGPGRDRCTPASSARREKNASKRSSGTGGRTGDVLPEMRDRSTALAAEQRTSQEEGLAPARPIQ